MDLSIIIPAYDEAHKIRRDIEAASEFLAARKIEGEIIVSDDGSRDNTPLVAQGTRVPPGIGFTVLRASEHRGKGRALRAGITASRGAYVMFADSGLTTPYDNVLRGLELISSGRCEIAHGSRKLPGSIVRVPQDHDRKITSAIFRAVVRFLLDVPRELTDTQCGFKVYRGDVARELAGECFTDGFMFDVEMILRARRHGYNILEFPIEWSCDRDSRLTFRRSSLPILQEMLELRREFSPGSSKKP
jgi:dolichyl-phosphate beta-glucosyltransferase